MSKELIHIWRGPIVESIHRGDIAVVDIKGNLLYKVGSPQEKVTYIRSAAKPIQAVPVVASGAVDAFGITEKEMTIFCASHSGEEEHTTVVRSILKKIGLDESYLQCGVHAPLYKKAAQELLLAGIEPSEVHNNCSGKHSGMLTLAQHLKCRVDNYTDIANPVQQAMRQSMADFAGLAAEDIILGIDGCGVPVHGISVYHMARAWANFATPTLMPAEQRTAAQRLAQAILNNPSKIAGTDRFCTALVSSTNRKLVAKSGAQGVYCIGLLDKGIGIALKIEDGTGKAAYSAAVEVLKQLNVLTEQELEALSNFHHPLIKNHRQDIVGEMKPIFTLEKC